MTVFRYILATALALAAFWWWPLAALAIVLLGATGSVAAPALGLFFDLLWGAPTGALHVVYFPFALLGALCWALYLLGRRYTFDRSGSDRL